MLQQNSLHENQTLVDTCKTKQQEHVNSYIWAAKSTHSLEVNVT